MLIMTHEFSVARYVFAPVGSNMYVLTDGSDTAVVIDPNASEEAVQALRQQGVRNILLLLTHEHFDHTSGVNLFQASFRTTLVCHRLCAERIADPRNNRPLIVAAMLLGKQEDSEKLQALHAFKPYACTADVTFQDTYTADWNGKQLFLQRAPGHTDASALIFLDSEAVFTGDSLIPDTPTIFRFRTGSEEAYRTFTLPMLLQISGERMIYPGHGVPFPMKNCTFSGDRFTVAREE